MFSGIVEGVGRVEALRREEGNLHLTLSCSFVRELHIDQSLSHNGVCLTVVDFPREGQYTVTAIAETLEKSNLGELKVGDSVNLERSLKLDSRLDGHIVQGHVDTTAVCRSVRQAQGSYYYHFEYVGGEGMLTVEKGSITVNGVSLTVVNSSLNAFEVAIIPYTYEHTNFKEIEEGTRVNLEFDVIGKYISRLMEAYRESR
jgi:riboflavin synthase, alpha subunit